MWSVHAQHRPVAYTGLHARAPRRAVVLHTNAGGTDRGSLFGWWSAVARQGQHLGAHFQIGYSIAEQYVDTAQVVYHAYGASEFAVGIETQDDGNPSTPWNDFQVGRIIAICRELRVPGQLLADGPSDGVGWHEQYRDWNRDGHRCPGSVREQQIHDVILPALRQHAKPAPPPPWYRRMLAYPVPRQPGRTRRVRMGGHVVVMQYGDDVRTVQRKVGAHDDGFYGPGTEAHVKAKQRALHLDDDGIVGVLTAKALGV